MHSAHVISRGAGLPQHARCGSPLETAIAVARESQNRLTSSVSRIRATALETDGSLCFDKRSEIAGERNSLRSNVNSEDACTTLFHPWANGYAVLYKGTSSTTPCHAISGNSTPSSIRYINASMISRNATLLNWPTSICCSGICDAGYLAASTYRRSRIRCVLGRCSESHFSLCLNPG